MIDSPVLGSLVPSVGTDTASPARPHSPSSATPSSAPPVDSVTPSLPFSPFPARPQPFFLTLSRLDHPIHPHYRHPSSTYNLPAISSSFDRLPFHPSSFIPSLPLHVIHTLRLRSPQTPAYPPGASPLSPSFQPPSVSLRFTGASSPPGAPSISRTARPFLRSLSDLAASFPVARPVSTVSTGVPPPPPQRRVSLFRLFCSPSSAPLAVFGTHAVASGQGRSLSPAHPQLPLEFLAWKRFSSSHPPPSTLCTRFIPGFPPIQRGGGSACSIDCYRDER